jgi:hypothetical protein
MANVMSAADCRDLPDELQFPGAGGLHLQVALAKHRVRGQSSRDHPLLKHELAE